MTIDRLHMRHRIGNETVTFEPSRFDRDVGTVDVRIEPDDQLDAGYYEALARLDRQSLGRLLYWLRTGEALPRDDGRLPPVFEEAP